MSNAENVNRTVTQNVTTKTLAIITSIEAILVSKVAVLAVENLIEDAC